MPSGADLLPACSENTNPSPYRASELRERKPGIAFKPAGSWRDEKKARNENFMKDHSIVRCAGVRLVKDWSK